jgi:acyl-CoA synthetase (AMP-forming)/AMP-acid ligase II
MADKVVITPDSTIPEVLKARIGSIPDQVAQVCGEERMTYGEFGRLVDKLASGLLDLGIEPGEKVALVLPGGNTFPVAMYAILRMGGVLVAVNPTLKAHEIKYVIENSDAVAVIVSEKFTDIDPLSLIREMVPELPKIRQVIVEGETSGSEISLQTLMGATEVRHEYHQADPHDLAALIYTSGTTGFPKGSMHSHYTLLYPLTGDPIKNPTPIQIMKIIWRYGLGYFFQLIKVYSSPLKILMSMPPYTGGGVTGMINYFLMGRIAVHIDRFTPTEFLKTIERERINILALTPALAKMMLWNPNIDQYDLSSLVYIVIGTAPSPPALVDEVIEKIKRPVMMSFGATELVGVPMLTNPFSDSRQALRETVGKIGIGWEARIVDENRQPVPTGEIGELVLRGGTRMLGYYKAEELTQEAFDDQGWYYTGDLATIDKQGYYRIVGRLKDMIIRAGQNIYPAELESVMVTHPKVHQVAVVGVPDAISGEKVVAFIVPKEGTEITPVEFLNFCRANLAPYKVPAQVYFMDEFPMNATGKVLKRILRDNVLAGM